MPLSRKPERHFVEVGVEKHDLPAQSSDLQPSLNTFRNNASLINPLLIWSLTDLGYVWRWTSEHHTYTWTFPKLLLQHWKLFKMFLTDVALLR